MDPWAWLAAGGSVMGALAALSVLLTFLLLERYWATGRQLRLTRWKGRGPSKGPPPPARIAGLRRMGLIRACVVIAPLLGLLGTVTGMIETFQSILDGCTITEVSRGIFKALFTTQYGLAIAAPALVAERVLARRVEDLQCRWRAAGLEVREVPACTGES